MKPKQLIFVLTIFALNPTTMFAQTVGKASEIQARCNDMSEKILSGDLAGGIRYVLPRLVELVGGPEKAMDMLNNSVTERRKTLGMKISCLAPTQFSTVGKRSFALIPTVNVTNGSKYGLKGQYLQERSILGVSTDQGDTWYFLDLHGDEPVPEALIPGGIGSIQPPPAKAGVFKAD